MSAKQYVVRIPEYEGPSNEPVRYQYLRDLSMADDSHSYAVTPKMGEAITFNDRDEAASIADGMGGWGEVVDYEPAKPKPTRQPRKPKPKTVYERCPVCGLRSPDLNAHLAKPGKDKRGHTAELRRRQKQVTPKTVDSVNKPKEEPVLTKEKPRTAKRATPAFYSIHEIAIAMRARPRTVSVWKSRGLLPEPDFTVGNGKIPVWTASTIEPWIREQR
jgi:hypothetical protein